MTQFKTAGFKEMFVEGCWNVHPPFSETFWKLSSSGAAGYDSKALDCRSLADSLRMKSPPEEGRGQEGAGKDLQPLDHGSLKLALPRDHQPRTLRDFLI